MHTETMRRRAFGDFYDAMGDAARNAADFVKRPTTRHATALRHSLLQTLGSIDALDDALERRSAEREPRA